MKTTLVILLLLTLHFLSAKKFRSTLKCQTNSCTSTKTLDITPPQGKEISKALLTFEVKKPICVDGIEFFVKDIKLDNEVILAKCNVKQRRNCIAQCIASLDVTDKVKGKTSVTVSATGAENVKKYKARATLDVTYVWSIITPPTYPTITYHPIGDEDSLNFRVKGRGLYVVLAEKPGDAGSQGILFHLAEKNEGRQSELTSRTLNGPNQAMTQNGAAIFIENTTPPLDYWTRYKVSIFGKKFVAQGNNTVNFVADLPADLNIGYYGFMKRGGPEGTALLQRISTSSNVIAPQDYPTIGKYKRLRYTHNTQLNFHVKGQGLYIVLAEEKGTAGSKALLFHLAEKNNGQQSELTLRTLNGVDQAMTQVGNAYFIQQGTPSFASYATYWVRVRDGVFEAGTGNTVQFSATVTVKPKFYGFMKRGNFDVTVGNLYQTKVVSSQSTLADVSVN